MQTKTILIAAVAVVLCGWLAAWVVWDHAVPQVPVETVALEQAGIQGQLTYLQGQMDGLKKEVADLRKVIAIHKKMVLAAKGAVLNTDQDIQKMVEAAMKEEPVPPVGDNTDLVKRARAFGVTTLVVR